jgi:hypothetical protein
MKRKQTRVTGDISRGQGPLESLLKERCVDNTTDEKAVND